VRVGEQDRGSFAAVSVGDSYRSDEDRGHDRTLHLRSGVRHRPQDQRIAGVLL
jgi:hypothetical protein